MNKNFIKAASLSLGLVVASLSLAGCNMGGGTDQGNRTTRQNTQQLTTPDGNTNRFLNMDMNPGNNNGTNNNLFGRNNGADNNGLLGGNMMGSPAASPGQNTLHLRVMPL